MRGRVRQVAIAGVAIAAAFGFGSVAPAGTKAHRTAALHEWICQVIDAAADTHRLPSPFLTRVLWQESRFRADVTSRASAAGVAQFMPGTAAERGLADPYDPASAIRQSARLLAELAARFGNLGLAAAAYNAGPARVWKWLHAQSGLPTETPLYVLAVTGRRAEEWRGSSGAASAGVEHGSCLEVTADLDRSPARLVSAHTPPARMAVWQIRLDEFLAKAVRPRQQRPGTAPVSNSNGLPRRFAIEYAPQARHVRCTNGSIALRRNRMRRLSSCYHGASGWSSHAGLRLEPFPLGQQKRHVPIWASKLGTARYRACEARL